MRAAKRVNVEQASKRSGSACIIDIAAECAFDGLKIGPVTIRGDLNTISETFREVIGKGNCGLSASVADPPRRNKFCVRVDRNPCPNVASIFRRAYGISSESAKGRYSPAECIGAHKVPIEGKPDPKHISTSFSERQNLTMRMSIRRFTRLTNAFSKKIEKHALSVALHYMHYNFARIHSTLRVSPAMAAGVTGTLWSIADIITMIDAYENSK